MGDNKNRWNNDAYGAIILILIGAIIGYLSFFVMQLYAQWFVLPFFIFDVFIILASVYAIRQRYRKLTRNVLRDAAKNVQRISAGQEMDIPEEGSQFSEISELYGAIESLNKSLLSQSHSKDDVIGIINSIALNIELDKLLEDMLPKIIEGTGSNWGAFYLINSHSEKMELKSSVGFSKSVYKEFDIALGDGFVGRSAQTGEISIFNDIPNDTIYISKTFLGKIKPRAIMTVPISSEGETVAVLLLASIYDYNEEQTEIVKLIRYYIGSALMNGLTFERTKRLKNELLFQNQLIQNMNEELEEKVSGRTKFLNDVLDSIVDYAIISVDEQGRILTWNKGAEIMRGFKLEEVLGKPITDTFVGETIEDLLKKLEIVKNQEKFEDYRWVTKMNGERFYAHRILMALRDERNEITAFASIARNMTDNKELENKAGYLSGLCSLLLSREKTGVATLDENGIIKDANFKAAEIAGLPAGELSGVPFDSLLLNGDVFKRKLSACIDGSSIDTWLERLKTGVNSEVKISLKLLSAPGSSDKYAIAYITKI